MGSNVIPEGQQIKIDRSLTRPMYCKCKCQAFVPVMTFRFCPHLANPTGKDIILPEQGLRCASCGTIYKDPSELDNTPLRRSNL